MGLRGMAITLLDEQSNTMTPNDTLRDPRDASFRKWQLTGRYITGQCAERVRDLGALSPK